MKQQFAELAKNPEQLLAVGKALENLSCESLSSLPNVHIKAKDGQIQTIYFTPSSLDPHARSFMANELIDIGKLEEK